MTLTTFAGLTSISSERNILSMDGRSLDQWVASVEHCRRKCSVVSGSFSQRGHLSHFLVPAVYVVISVNNDQRWHYFAHDLFLGDFLRALSKLAVIF